MLQDAYDFILEMQHCPLAQRNILETFCVGFPPFEITNMNNKQKPRISCTKCTRLTPIHPLGLCAICRSNLPKYKKRKKKYRQSLKGMKTALLWRLAKYNEMSGETLTFATKTSKKRQYSIPERGAIAAINAKGLVSTSGTKKAFKEAAMAFGMKI